MSAKEEKKQNVPDRMVTEYPKNIFANGIEARRQAQQLLWRLNRKVWSMDIGSIQIGTFFLLRGGTLDRNES